MNILLVHNGNESDYKTDPWGTPLQILGIVYQQIQMEMYKEGIP